MISLVLHSFLVAKATGAAGVWPQMLPQNHQGFPAITYSIDDESDDQLIDGIGSLTTAVVTVDVWDASYITVHQIADALCKGLVGYHGLIGAYGSPEKQVIANHIRKERQLDLYDNDGDLHRVNLQFLIAYGVS
jgi:hypothetical protein